MSQPKLTRRTVVTLLSTTAIGSVQGQQAMSTATPASQHGYGLGAYGAGGYGQGSDSTGNTPPSVADYTNTNNVVDNSGVTQAILDWQNGTISNSLIVDVVLAWQSGNPVT